MIVAITKRRLNEALTYVNSKKNPAPTEPERDC
jgi:hypothetical protein